MFESLPYFQYGRYVLIALVVVFAIFALSRSYLRLKHGNESYFEFIMWTLLWTAIIVVVSFPDILGLPAKLLGIGRGIDVLVYFGILVLFYSVYRVYSKIERLEQEITSLTRSIAIENKERHLKTKDKNNAKR